MRNRRRNRNNVNTNMMAIEQEHTYADDAHYFIEKLRNKGSNFTVSLYSNANNPEYFANYIEFMKQYIGFTLTNISEVYNSLQEWIEKSPAIRSKIQFVDSNDIASLVSSYVTAYLDKKLTPSVKSIALSLLNISDEKTVINLETHNIPALAFLGPPGTSKTYSIVAALKELSGGQGNNKIAGWLHYDITKHEATTAPFVLPTANQIVKDDPLPGLALLRTSGDPELDKALSESIYTKTVNKIISTFAYILIAGQDKKRISLSREVENTLKKGANLESIELEVWKFVVTEELNETSIKQLLYALHEAISGLAKVTQTLAHNKSLIGKDASKLIDAISYIKDDPLGLDDPENYILNFRKIGQLLHKFITFSLVPIIAIIFTNFIKDKKLNQDKKTAVIDGIMYIYNKIHNYYLHRIISNIFLINALIKTGVEYEQFFKDMIRDLANGLNNLLENYYNSIEQSVINTYLDLEKENSLSDDQIKTFDFYDKFYSFLLNIPVNEKKEYVLLDKMFAQNVLSELVPVGSKNLSTDIAIGGEAELRQYRDNKVKRYSSVKYSDTEFEYFPNSKLSFIDHISLISDTINDLYEMKRFYSNVGSDNPEAQESKTTLEKLKDEFGREFLKFSNTSAGNVINILSRIFRFIDQLKNKFSKEKITFYKNIYNDKDSLELLNHLKIDCKDLFMKSLSIFVYNPRYGNLLNVYGNSNQIENLFFELIGEYILSGLDITESFRTKGASYSFPPAVQVFIAKAREAYYKYLRDLRAMIASQLNRMDLESYVETFTGTLRPPLYVLFIDEIMTQMTQEGFLFWLNIWNGLISPANTTVDTYPPNLCFILAGNMPRDTRILAQVLAQSSTEQDIKNLQQPGDKNNIPIRISVDTLNALGSRISVKVVTYDYAYLLRTDESIARKRTALFIKALTNGLLNHEELIQFANTAQDLLGGYYDYYELIVKPRLARLPDLLLSNEQRMELHAYIISLTAAPDNIPFNINYIVPNSTIKDVIYGDKYRNISSEVKDLVIRKATILNYLFNNKTFGRTIYDYMFRDYFKNNIEAVYFNRLINIAISPIILHLSFLHSYLTWNNMMRRVTQKLLNIAETSKDKPEIVEAVTKLMKEIKNTSKLINKRMTNHNSIKTEFSNLDSEKVNDRIEIFNLEKERNTRIEFIKNQSDPRLCNPEVGAVVSLLSLVFYHYIKYMKEFNKDISNSIITFCENLEVIIRNEAKSSNDAQVRAFNDLKWKINNYFVDPEQDIESREDLLRDANVFENNLDNAVRINILSFNPNMLTVTLKTKDKENKEFTYSQNAYNSITVTLIPNVKDSDTGRGLNKKDIEAIKSLVAYTIYTHSLVMKKKEDNTLVFSGTLIDNIVTTNDEHVPLLGNLALNFFRATEENKLFLIEPLREADRWFTNVTGSIVKYVTTMTILKHILTYNQQTGRNMISEFINVVSSSNNMTQDVKSELENIIDEFSKLLFMARKAVFTPLAAGGEAASNNQYIRFPYNYYDRSEVYEGYYTKPDNQVNFGQLEFVFEKLKNQKLVQYENPNELIKTIAERFVQYIKSKHKRSTTSFFPIHLISHINLEETAEIEREKYKTIRMFSDISSFIYNNSEIHQITTPSMSFGSEDRDMRHEHFYDIKSKALSIIAIAQVLNNRLESVEELERNFKSIYKLLKLNQELIKAANSGSNAIFIQLIRENVKLDEIYQMITLNDGVFEFLRKVKSRYPSVESYVRTWDNEKDKISDFFILLLQGVAQSNVDALTETVVGIYEHLDKYIAEVTEKLLERQIEYKNVKIMLDTIYRNKNDINGFIKQKIKEIIDSLEENHMAPNDVERYQNIKECNSCIEYQSIVLTPLIKYSLAIILSNIFLIESEKSGTFWSGDKNSFYQELDKAIRNSYNKTIDTSKEDTVDTDYLSMIIRYILFDMNQYQTDDNQIKLSADLLGRSPRDLDAPEQQDATSTGLHLVKPFFTSYNEQEAKMEKRDVENNKKVITKREVFTQYVYAEDQDGNPSLYCDIHHMPIKAVQFLDGTEKEVGSKITIYSSEPPQRNPNEYVYTQLTFIQNMIVPRYEFAKSVLVNLLLISGIQQIQKYLSAGGSGINGFSSAQFVSFAVTNLYLYYQNEIEKSELNAKKFIEMVIENKNSNSKRKPLHPLLASVMILLNGNSEEARKVKELLKVDYGYNKGTNTYSRRDDLINALRLRFYSSEDIGLIKSTEYEMYSIYEPGVSIELGS